MLSLYLDSAVQRDVEPLLELGVFRGVTTNPSILQRAELTGHDLPDIYRWAFAAGAQELMVQAWGADADEIEASGRQLLELGPGVIVKIAATPAGIRAAKRLIGEGVPILLTAIYAAHQALTAAAIGATYLAPYVGKMAEEGRPAREETVTMHRILRGVGAPTRVLAASLRSTSDVVHLAEQGVDAFTLPVVVARRMFDDPSTTAAAAGFDAVTGTW